MKVFSLPALSLALCLLFLPVAPLRAKEKTKITKNEAEHIALKRHRDSRVSAASLETVDGKLVWSIEIASRKGKAVTRVTVDAMSGRVLSAVKEKR